MEKYIRVLVSDVGRFEIKAIQPTLDVFQEIVGGYIEAIIDPEDHWHVYLNEEGKLRGLPINPTSTLFLDQLYVSDGRRPFSSHDHVVGSVVWMGGQGDAESHSFPVDYMRRYARVALDVAWQVATPVPLVVVIKQGNDVLVYDNKAENVVELASIIATRAETVGKHAFGGSIEVYPGVSRDAWVELRVELMDHPEVTLHDNREDRSYG